MTNPIFDAYFHSDLFGKAIFLALFALSLVTWVLFLQKLSTYRNLEKKSLKLREKFLRRSQNPLTIEVETTAHPFIAIYRTLQQEAIDLMKRNQALGHPQTLLPGDMEIIDESIYGVRSNEVKRFGKHLFLLSTIVTLAPFLGLLGTVWGILLTFAELVGSGASAGANATVMGGLAMALGTTVVGLIVAIPALIGYNYLKAALASLSSELEDFSRTLLLSLERHFVKSCPVESHEAPTHLR